MNLLSQFDKLLPINKLKKFTHDYPSIRNKKRLRINKGYLESKLFSQSHDSCNGSSCDSLYALQH